MSVNIGNLPFFRKGYKKKPLPSWLQKWIFFQKVVRYKDLLVPFVQFKVVAKDDSGGVFIGISINGKDIYGSILTFPYSWKQSLVTMDLFRGFEIKLSRHLNMVAKGSSRGTPQQIKLAIDSTFLINCVISPKQKKIKSPPIILNVNPKGQVVNIKGKVVGMSGTVFATALRRGFNPMSYAQSLSKKKKKKKSFNPSRR